MSEYVVHARRWEHGWELHVDGEGVTQTRALSRAVGQVRDYLSTVHDRDMGAAAVRLVVDDLGELNDEVTRVRELQARADDVRRSAAKRSRALARALKARGLSGADAAAVLQVSEQRVSQLTKAG